MQTIYFATTNPEKLHIARTVCAEAGLSVEPAALAIDEIQGEDPELIVRDKARRAFALFGKPIVVSDDTWDIRALRGFPGPYMKSVSHWFTPQDFLRLMDGVQDRTITLHQYLAYTDGATIKLFTNDIQGEIIREARGQNPTSSNMAVTALDSDGGKTLAEVFARGEQAVAERYKNRPDAWHELVRWYLKAQAA